MSIQKGLLLDGAGSDGTGDVLEVPSRNDVTLYPVATGSTSLAYLVEGRNEFGDWHPVHAETLSGASGPQDPVRVDGYFSAYRATVSDYSAGEITVGIEIY